MVTTEQLAHQTAPSGPAGALPRIALVGVHGFGTHHLANLDRLQAAGVLELVAVADPNPPATGTLAPTVKVFDDLAGLLAADLAPDVIIIATPIQTHAALGLAALAAGSDVYLEKPTAASMAQFEELRQAAGNAGRAVQIGFQSLGSLALPALAKIISDGGLGTVRGYSATGMWLRDKAYYQRSRWAGKRTINGIDVVDGVTTNPLAHAVATALHIAGINSATAIDRVDTDLYRAHDIEGDDTSSVRIVPFSGPSLTAALTVCAADESDPFVTVHGSTGKATFYYTEDILEITTAAGPVRQQFGRTDLLENLLAHRSDGTPLLSSLDNSGAFMRVLEAVRTAEDPAPISGGHVDWVGEDLAAHPVIKDIELWIARCTEAQATFSEVGAPWARPGHAANTMEVAGCEVARENDGATVSAMLSPRPFLHPVRTLKGAVVTAVMPADHSWHLGAGVAMPAVSGVNFWGGPSYNGSTGEYEWLADHGRITLESSQDSAGENVSSRTQQLRWCGPDGTVLLREQRTWSWCEADFGAWTLTLSTTLSAAGTAPVTLDSPGSVGRAAAGYGGFFWRLPASENATVRTPGPDGGEAANGTTSPWLAWSGDVAGGPVTLLFTAPAQAPTPWFVRMTDYPGVGSSFAWDTTTVVNPGEPLSRSLRITIADGIAGESQLAHWASTP